MVDVFDIRKGLGESGIFFVYSGALSHGILTSLVESLEDNCNEWITHRRKANCILVILIEMVQNIINYSILNKDSHFPAITNCEGTILLGFDPAKDKLFLKSGNIVEAKHIKKIEKRIEEIIVLDRENTRLRYRELRRSGKNASERGAGLGFLEIQRKTTEPLSYSLKDLKDGSYYYTLEAFI